MANQMRDKVISLHKIMNSGSVRVKEEEVEEKRSSPPMLTLERKQPMESQGEKDAEVFPKPTSTSTIMLTIVLPAQPD